MDTATNSGVTAATVATEKNQGIFEQEGSGFRSFNKIGISVNPNYQKSTNPQELEAQARQTFHNDKTARMIHESHKTREFRTIDLDHLELDANGLIKSMGEGGLEAEESFEIKICRVPGETYTSTCKRQLKIEIKVTPPQVSKVPYCPGHTEYTTWRGEVVSWWSYNCGGCRTYDQIVPEKAEVIDEQWVGCEAEDKTHEEGLCELIDELPGPYKETRIMNGLSITKDYWETTRVYRCGSKVQ
jgi:hypothetical protein